MLNVALLENALLRAGLSQAALARKLHVSREAVSKWFKGQAQPRPMALVNLCEILSLEIDQVWLSGEPEQKPIIAFRTRSNRAPTSRALEAVEEHARFLMELAPYLRGVRPDFEPPVLRSPTLDEEFISRVGEQLRSSIDLREDDSLELRHLVQLHENFGSVLVPVLWGGERAGHENAINVYLPDSRINFVVFNLNCRIDDLKYWLAHELGHCYTLPKLVGTEGEKFSERLAAKLLFPRTLAADAYEKIISAEEPLAQASHIAGLHKISVITVVKEVSRYAQHARLKDTNLDNERLYQFWRQLDSPSAASILYGDDRPSPEHYIRCGEKIFRSNIFAALARQQEVEGKSAARIASTLQIGLKDAWTLAQALDEARAPI